MARRKSIAIAGVADRLTACACLLELAEAGLALRRGDSAKLYRAQLDVQAAMDGLRAAISELDEAGAGVSTAMAGLQRANHSLVARARAWGKAGY